MDDTDAKLDALWLKNELAWLKNRIRDHCEDFGSTDGTPAGIADPKERARCEIEIKREHRDHAQRIREHNARRTILRAHDMAREQERAARDRDARMAPQENDPAKFLSPATIYRRFGAPTTKRAK